MPSRCCFTKPGFEVIKLEPSGNEVKVTLKVAPDCRLGEHVAQVRTRSGVSDFRTLFVGALPEVSEVEPNSAFDQPQGIPLNVTVQGIVENEDVDYYLVEAEQGQRIAVEVEAMRLGSTLFDPYVAILDLKRFELSASDDTPLAVQDAFVSMVTPQTGKYVIEVRESAYGGNGECRYRLHVGTFPRPTAVFPAGGKLGELTTVRFLGDAAGELTKEITLPTEPIEEFGLFAEDPGGVAPSPNPFRLVEYGNAFEAEPNNELSQATLAELPLALNGIIEKEGDVDCFRFAAQKGQVFEVECYARRIRSGLDAVVNLYHADGRGITGNDDARGPDSYFRFEVPEDAEYIVRVTDHLGRGAPDFVYRVELQPVKPTLQTGIPRVERYGQYLQQIYVPRGNRFGAVVSANRANFGGELVLEVNDLPAGISMQAEPMSANLNLMPVVFEAAADAPLAGKLIDLAARHADPSQNIRGAFFNRADFLVAEPGQSLYVWKDVRQVPIAVVEELPFAIEIVEPGVPLVQNGTMLLKIIAHKQEGWDETIDVRLPFLPPGVGSATSVKIEKGQTEVLYPLNANGGAAVGQWRIFARAQADLGGAALASSQLATLEVAPPLVTFEMQRASCEQGQPAQVYCKINHLTPFEGQAQAQLLGLPNKVTAADVQFDKDTAELTFAVSTDATSPTGKHGSLFCQVTILRDGEPIVATAGGTELQIDAPPPAPVAPAEPAAAQPQQVAESPPAQPTARPLSRLEKLRLQAQERSKNRQGREVMSCPATLRNSECEASLRFAWAS